MNVRPKPKVVIDTNVFVSAYLSSSGFPAKVIDLWIAGHFDICVSDDILDEYFRVMLKIGIAPSLVRLLNRRLKYYAFKIEPASEISAIEEDPSDDKFLECAQDGNADFIVSGDKHLLKLRRFRDISILSPADFLKNIL